MGVDSEASITNLKQTEQELVEAAERLRWVSSQIRAWLYPSAPHI